MPSRDADDLELLGIGAALGVTGTGAFGMNSDFDDEGYESLDEEACQGDRPSGLVPAHDRYTDPQRWRRLMKAVMKRAPRVFR